MATLLSEDSWLGMVICEVGEVVALGINAVQGCRC
jgi:hypothetical protein